jgi:hypothetical protein
VPDLIGWTAFRQSGSFAGYAGAFQLLGGILNQFPRRAGSAVVQGKAREAWFGHSK